MSPLIVIDANITLAQVLPLPYTDLVTERMETWRQGRIGIVVPALWEYEVVSGLRKAVVRGYLTQEQAFQALEAILNMGLEQVYPSVELDKMALAWAGTLALSNVYDGQYLAVAKALGAEFWTADRRLANNLHQRGESWVHWIGESGD